MVADPPKLETLLFERRGRVALVTLNRPERLNAVSRRMIGEMHSVLDHIEADAEIGAIVLTGAGRAFCSGMDLKDDAAAGPNDVGGWRRVLNDDFEFLMRFWRSPIPTIAAVHGFCLAAGCELAMACDVTIAEEGCYLGEPELRFGSVITALMMPWLTGPKLAKELLLSADDRITAERAERIGLINRIAQKGKCLEEALTLATRMATMDKDAVAMTKEAINRTFEIMGLHEALKANLDVAVQLESLETPSRKQFREITAREGLQAALKWRDERFSG